MFRPPYSAPEYVPDAVGGPFSQHPATARDIARKLSAASRRGHPESLVARVATLFTLPAGTQNPLVPAILSRRIRRPSKAQVETPFRYFVSALRAIGRGTRPLTPLIEYLIRMGRCFSALHARRAPDASAPWLGTFLWRWNFASRSPPTKCRPFESQPPS